MRDLRKVLMLAVMAVAAMAFAASSASAQEVPVEVWDEHANAPCGTAPGCAIHAEGESHIRNNIVGAETSTCFDHFEGFIRTNGTGEIEWVGEPHGGVGCNIVNCNSGTEAHWPITASGELGGEREHLNIRICVESPPDTVDRHCNFEVQVVDTAESAHDYALAIVQNCLGAAITWEGLWSIGDDPDTSPDAHDEIELVHAS